jgi:hypothetical protein
VRRLGRETAVTGVGNGDERQRGAESKHENGSPAPHRRVASYEEWRGHRASTYLPASEIVTRCT